MNPHKKIYCIGEEATIADALTVITENKRGGAIILGSGGLLFGVISDGDVRRALVRGGTLLTPISKFTNRDVLSFPDSGVAAKEVADAFATHPGVNLIPVITATNRVVDVIVRGQEGQ